MRTLACFVAHPDNRRHNRSTDTSFEEYIDHFDRPHAFFEKIQPFRFVTLPTELHVKIIRYASTDDYQHFYLMEDLIIDREDGNYFCLFFLADVASPDLQTDVCRFG